MIIFRTKFLFLFAKKIMVGMLIINNFYLKTLQFLNEDNKLERVDLNSKILIL